MTRRVARVLPRPMTMFAKRLTRCPDAYDPDRGDDTAGRYGDLPSELLSLVRGTAGSSPFLRAGLDRDRDWAIETLNGSPEAARDAVLADVETLDFASLKPGLRLAKRRIALLTALADLGGVWSLEEVTGTLTWLADLATGTAIRELVAHEQRRGKLPDATRDAPAGGMTALAMGKMGAFELNYSSDIDLICLFDDALYPEDTYLEARSGFVRATRAMAQVLSEVTADGYVFRTDLRLRPDASVTPVCLPMEAAERYYESAGRTWERAAYIKARACAGDIAGGERFLTQITPFIWRRHLDYAAIQDAHDMRLKIREHKGLSSRADLPGYDIKLGPGGIREIEFFTQTRQIIAGGRDPSLRLRGTEESLARLVDTGWVEADAAAQLTDDYRAHRELEHRLQMVDDQQTQSLPRDDAGFDRIAALMGTSAEALKADVAERLKRVASLTEDFFEPAPVRKSGPELSQAARDIVERWPSYPALRSQRAVEIFDRVRPELLSRLERATNPDTALRHIDRFLAGLPAGVQLFSLFDANPGLLDLTIDIMDISPDLADYLARNASVFDAVIGGSFFEPWPGPEVLTSDLVGRLAGIDDYERKLDAARIWRREWAFRVGVHLLRGLIDARTAGEEFSDIAGAVLAALAPPVIAEFARKHGDPPGRGVAFLGMGSLGAAQLNAASDLDLIAIYDAAGVEQSDGRRPLPARTYYARLTQAFITSLTAQMAEGWLYEVDMRLRPSGRQGPVATSFDAFESYQRSEAWTWEHLALTRARFVAGNADLGAEIEAMRCDVLASQHDRAKVLADVADMRARLAEAKPAKGPLDPKFGAGRLQDIELIAQTAALLSGAPDRGVAAQLSAGGAALGLDQQACDTLAEAHAVFWQVQSAARVIGPGAGDIAALGEGARQFLCRTAGVESIDALEAELSQHAAAVSGLVDELLGRKTGEG